MMIVVLMVNFVGQIRAKIMMMTVCGGDDCGVDGELCRSHQGEDDDDDSM